MPNRTQNKPSHITRGGNVFADLEFSPEKALALEFKAKILAAILGEVRRKKITQSQVVQLLDEHQPVVSNLLLGKISQMSIEKLLVYAARLGLSFGIQKSRRPARRRAA